jgi:hypothetical protein
MCTLVSNPLSNKSTLGYIYCTCLKVKHHFA